MISYQAGDVPRSKRLAAHAELDFIVAALSGGMTASGPMPRRPRPAPDASDL
jgi:hypothetical protein